MPLFIKYFLYAKHYAKPLTIFICLVFKAAVYMDVSISPACSWGSQRCNSQQLEIPDSGQEGGCYTHLLPGPNWNHN